MDSVNALLPLREVIARYDLMARKSLGQHFLLDLNLTARIANGADLSPDTHVIEVGPGPGGLTRALLQTPARHVTVIERDARFIPALEEIAAVARGRLTIVTADALKVDYAALAPAPRAIVSNLPYNVGTPLLIHWLEHSALFQSLTLMFQKEVAERIVATPGAKEYGRLAVMAQWRAEARILFTVPARAFTPPPKVDSAIVQLIPKALPAQSPSWDVMEKVVAAAFNQRRKMLRAALRTLVDRPETWLESAGIDPTRRAEDISVADYLRLAGAFSSTHQVSKIAP